MRVVGRNRGAAVGADEVDLTVVGELEEAELGDLELGRPGFRGPPAVQRLRDTHHGLARALASGMTQGEAGRVAGYTATRVSMLMQDPAFEELVASYRAVEDELWRNEQAAIQENAYATLAMGLRMKRDKLEEADEAGELPSHHELDNTIRIMGEFTGLSAARRTVNTNVNANLGDLLAAARQRAFGADPQLSLVSGSSRNCPPGPPRPVSGYSVAQSSPNIHPEEVGSVPPFLETLSPSRSSATSPELDIAPTPTLAPKSEG